MEPLKRTRIEVKHYSDRRYNNKRVKNAESGNFSAPINALIFDNGGHNIKIGFNQSKEPTLLPNYIMKAKSERKRAFISDQIEDCRDLSGLYFITPNEKGYITKFDIQKNIWDYVFNKFPIEDKSVVMTQPIFNFRAVQEYTDEIFFEEYDVKYLHRATGTDYSYYNYINKFKGLDVPCIVVDSGFSFTHIVPYIGGKKFAEGVVRMNVGGKLLTNYLKDILSYRQLHVMEETYVINHVKEDICFMSQDFNKDMIRARSTNEIVKNYVLPDFHNIRRGYVQEKSTDELAENCQILRLNNERITVPEIMIRPSIIPGFESAGLGQCIAHAISKCPEQYRKALSNNVILTGGNCMFPGFRSRIERETRIFLPCKNDLNIYQPENSLIYPWLGGKCFSRDSKSKALFVTKQQYEENGNNYTYEKFNQYCKPEESTIPKRETLNTPSSFSYLNYWKNEGVDVIRSESRPVSSDIQFKLEGENLEEFDGKYVTIEFEYEEPKEPLVKNEVETKTPNVAKLRTAKPLIVSSQETQTGITTKQQIISSLPKNLFNTTFLPKLTCINPKVYRPAQTLKGNESPRIISINNPITLKDKTLLTTHSMTGSPNNKIFNNSVLLPSNLISAKSLTFQIIPIKPELMKPANIIITKTTD